MSDGISKVKKMVGPRGDVHDAPPDGQTWPGYVIIDVDESDWREYQNFLEAEYRWEEFWAVCFNRQKSKMGA